MLPVDIGICTDNVNVNKGSVIVVKNPSPTLNNRAASLRKMNAEKRGEEWR
jgi:hypothetical protein